VLPKGNYKAVLQDLQIQENKAGTGIIGRARFEVIEGEFGRRDRDGKEEKGMLDFHTFNFTNPNPKAVEISNKTLNELLRVAGVQGGIDALGHDFNAIKDAVSDAEFIIAVDRQSSYKDASGAFLKIDAMERRDLDSLMPDELEERGLVKNVNNRVLKILAA
jgi:hypothetical protein